MRFKAPIWRPAAAGLWAGLLVGATMLVLVGVETWAGQEYVDDGEPGPIEEEIRWLANRARFAPDLENERLGSNYSVADGPLQPLAPNAMIIRANRRHAEDLASTGTFQHETPAGSAYYTEGAKPWDRATQEGYRYRAFAENIAAGYRDGVAAHEGWFHSSGHRVNLLNPDMIEIGVGFHFLGSSPYGRYYSQGFGKPSGVEHFFTGTLFYDSNQDEVFSSSEAVAGVELHLVYSDQGSDSEHDWFDRSSPSGSVAVPIASIPDGTRVTVRFVNPTGSAVTLTLPTGFSESREITIAAGATVDAGQFSQPSARSNVGLRDLSPIQPELPLINGLTFHEGEVWIHATTPTSGICLLEASEDVKDWVVVQTLNVDGHQSVFVDADGVDRASRFYRLRTP